MFTRLVNAAGFCLQNSFDQRELQRRYDHIHRHLDVRGARTQLSTIGILSSALTRFCRTTLRELFRDSD